MSPCTQQSPCWSRCFPRWPASTVLTWVSATQGLVTFQPDLTSFVILLAVLDSWQKSFYLVSQNLLSTYSVSGIMTGNWDHKTAKVVFLLLEACNLERERKNNNKRAWWSMPWLLQHLLRIDLCPHFTSYSISRGQTPHKRVGKYSHTCARRHREQQSVQSGVCSVSLYPSLTSPLNFCGHVAWMRKKSL